MILKISTPKIIAKILLNVPGAKGNIQSKKMFLKA